MSSRATKQILSWYPELTTEQQKNFSWLIEHGRIGGSGKFVILPVDQGFEHGPNRSFRPNPAGYNPRYHATLAVKAGCNAYAAPLGALEAAADIIKKSKLPTILKVNSHDLLTPDDNDPFPALTSWVEDAVRLKSAAVGITIYPGSAHAREQYQQVRELVRDARKAGLVVVVWAYPRGSGLPDSAAETAVDIVAYAVHIACQLGAHIVKCKATTAHIGLPSNIKRNIFEGLSIALLEQRTKLVMQAAFDSHRVVICSGGDVKNTKELLTEVRGLAAGGAFGSIVGRNAFQRPEAEAVKLLNNIQDIYTSV